MFNSLHALPQVECLKTWQLNKPNSGNLEGTILYFIGPPGVGKSIVNLNVNLIKFHLEASAIHRHIGSMPA